MPYVYQVKHRETGEFYIGSKYAIGATPENTHDYFGTPKGKSKRCSRYKYLLLNEKHLLDKNIIGLFDTKQDALDFEIKMHNKLFNDKLCLNGAKQTSSGFSALFSGNEHPMFGKIHTQETCKKMSLAKLGKPFPHSAKHNENIGLAQKGRKFTEEHKEKLRIAKIGEKRIKNKIVVCPYCNKQGGSTGMKRYHFDNCKNKGLICQL